MTRWRGQAARAWKARRTMTTPDTFERDVLIGRIVDGEASPEDWQRLATMAAGDQAVWAEVADTQRAHDALARAVERITAPADFVDLPSPGHAGENPVQHRLNLVSRWGGWAAAAAIVMVWTLGLRPPQTPVGQGERPQSAGLVSWTPDEAFSRYVDAGKQSGQVVQELPERVVYDTRPLESGGFEVLYIRQVLERRVVDEVYRRAADEFGRPVEVPARFDRLPPRAF